MKKSIWLYGLGLALITIVLRQIEYRYMLRDLSVELLVLILATIFTGLGVWVAWQFMQGRTTPTRQQLTDTNAFSLDAAKLEHLGISQREYEVLELMAAGLSNQEIADRLFISLNTVKTHSSNLYAKLDVKRRTQAVQKAQELQLIQ